jgi:hypothetical protein
MAIGNISNGMPPSTSAPAGTTAPKTETVGQTDFVRDLSADHGRIDLDDLSDPTKAAIDQAGVKDELVKIAGKDHAISGRAEFKKLFGTLDRVDGQKHNKPFASKDADGAPTRAGALYDALKNEVAANRAVKNAQVSSPRLSNDHGVLDTNPGRISPRLRGEFDKAGISPRAFAGADGQIKGDEFKNLFKAIGGNPNTIDTKQKKSDGSVVDTPNAPLANAIQDEVADNRTKPEYAAPHENDHVFDHWPLDASNALKVPKEDQKSPVHLGMKGVDQIALFPDDPKKAQRACGKAARQEATDYLKANFKKKDRPELDSNDQAIQVAYAKDNYQGRLDVDRTQAKLARDYIDRALDKHYPVMVGTSHHRGLEAANTTDPLTNHFVTIDSRDYDDEGRLYYGFKDPGYGGEPGKFYVDQDSGVLYKPAATVKHPGHLAVDDEYQVSHVKTYKGL